MATRPRMLGFQAAGAAPLVVGHRIEHPETIATAIRIGDPASWTKAVEARDASGGRITAVTDDEILAAYRALARYEGIFCEPASAASVAGVTKAAAAGELDPAATIVCVLTGHGLKDPTTAERQVPPFLEAEPTVGVGRRRARLVGTTMAGGWLAELDGSRVTVEVPASSANLGAGYDCLGVALAMTNRIDLEVRAWGRGEIELTVEGEGRNELTEDRDNRFVQGLEAALRAARGDLPDEVGWRIAMHNDIPLARGLGSSAAATVGGVLAGNALVGEALSMSELLGLACAIEGHPDNAAAALLGGFVVSAAADGADGVDAIRFDAPRDLRAVVFIPELRLATHDMRAALPATVPLADAVANLSAVAIGVAGLAIGRYELLARLTVDRLHEPVSGGGLSAAAADGRRRRARPAPSAPSCRAPGRPSSRSPIRWPGSPGSKAAFIAAAADSDLPGTVRVVEPRNAGGRVVTSS